LGDLESVDDASNLDGFAARINPKERLAVLVFRKKYTEY
jgi:hypothetical protein